jgi:lipopolysaccharide transport system ATP-binding protein
MDEIRSYAGLGDFFDQPVRSYSSGMRARLGFSVAIHVDPDVMLLDEVLGVGDADFRKKSALTMHEKINSNKTVVLVSHHMGLISRVCDRVVWLYDHGVKMVGETKEVLEAFKKEN